ncbi:MAG: 50S ribosomal protein L29 [Coriobacteriia bacterium]|nr:50S ribosomal protein L29 [Coriobacteriia bacterium]MDO9107669.1 50S ribosomal protein L29 [Coriobacteriia bacterium]
MKATEVRELTDIEIVQKIADARTELFNLRFRLATGQLDNPAQINAVKKNIARLHTELRARELRAARDAAAL